MLNVKDFKVDKVYGLLICYFNIELIIVFVIGKILKGKLSVDIVVIWRFLI